MIDEIHNSGINGIGEFGNSRNLKIPKKSEFQNSKKQFENEIENSSIVEFSRNFN